MPGGVHDNTYQYMYTRGGGEAAETWGPDVVSLVILVPVQPLLVELDNDLRSIMFFMFFNNGFNLARDLKITQIHGRCRPHMKSGFRSGFKDHNAPWLKTIHQFEDMISTTHSFKVVLTVTAPENVNIPHSHLGDLQICLFGGHQICLI